MKSGALRAALDAARLAALRSGAHPHAVPRPLRGRALCPRAAHPGRWRPTTLSSRSTCITTCRCCRARSAARWRAASRARSARSSAAWLRLPSRCAQLLLEYGVSTRIEVIPTGLPADRYVRGRRRDAFARSFGIPPIGRCCCTSGAWRTRRTSSSCCTRSSRCVARGPMRMFVIAGEGPARAASAGARGAHSALRRTCISSAIWIASAGWPTAMPPPMCSCSPRAPRRRVWCCSRRWRRAGRWSRRRIWARPRFCKPGCGARVAPEKPDAFAQAVADILDDPARAARLSSQARSYAQSWASAHMARRLASLYRELTAPTPLRGAARQRRVARRRQQRPRVRRRILRLTLRCSVWARPV